MYLAKIRPERLVRGKQVVYVPQCAIAFERDGSVYVDESGSGFYRLLMDGMVVRDYRLTSEYREGLALCVFWRNYHGMSMRPPEFIDINSLFFNVWDRHRYSKRMVQYFLKKFFFMYEEEGYCGFEYRG